MFTVEINDELADDIVVTRLEEIIERRIEELKKLFDTEDVIGHHSFDYDEEVFGMVDDIRSLSNIIKYFGGREYNLNIILENINQEMYSAVIKFDDMKKEKEKWQREALVLQDEMNKLKNNLSGLIN